MTSLLLQRTTTSHSECDSSFVSEALLYHYAGAGASVSGAPIPHGSHPFLSGPLPTTALSSLPSSADAATVTGKASPPARTKTHDRTPKGFVKKSPDTKLVHEATRDNSETAGRTVAHTDTKLVHEATRDNSETAGRTVAHTETQRRVSNGKQERRDTVTDNVNGGHSSHKRGATASPDTGARRRRMRSDNTNTLPARSPAVGEASPRVNGSDARKEKRAEEIESGREREESPQTSLPRPDRKSRAATSGHGANRTSATNSRTGYKTPPGQ